MDCSALVSSVHGIAQARILEWVAFLFLTQGSKPNLLHHRQILYHQSHQGSPDYLLLHCKLSIAWTFQIHRGQWKSFSAQSSLGSGIHMAREPSWAYALLWGEAGGRPGSDGSLVFGGLGLRKWEVDSGEAGTWHWDRKQSYAVNPIRHQEKCQDRHKDTCFLLFIHS